MTRSEKEQPKWDVKFSTSAEKQKKQLPRKVSEVLARLVKDLEIGGYVQKSWPHFSSLGKGKRIPTNSYHCHIKRGRPTYVACWQMIDKKIQIMEIFYVGTHENAPY